MSSPNSLQSRWHVNPNESEDRESPHSKYHPRLTPGQMDSYRPHAPEPPATNSVNWRIRSPILPDKQSSPITGSRRSSSDVLASRVQAEPPVSAEVGFLLNDFAKHVQDETVASFRKEKAQEILKTKQSDADKFQLVSQNFPTLIETTSKGLSEARAEHERCCKETTTLESKRGLVVQELAKNFQTASNQRHDRKVLSLEAQCATLRTELEQTKLHVHHRDDELSNLRGDYESFKAGLSDLLRDCRRIGTDTRKDLNVFESRLRSAEQLAAKAGNSFLENDAFKAVTTQQRSMDKQVARVESAQEENQKRLVSLSSWIESKESSKTINLPEEAEIRMSKLESELFDQEGRSIIIPLINNEEKVRELLHRIASMEEAVQLSGEGYKRFDAFKQKDFEQLKQKMDGLEDFVKDGDNAHMEEFDRINNAVTLLRTQRNTAQLEASQSGDDRQPFHPSKVQWFDTRITESNDRITQCQESLKDLYTKVQSGRSMLQPTSGSQSLTKPSPTPGGNAALIVTTKDFNQHATETHKAFGTVREELKHMSSLIGLIKGRYDNLDTQDVVKAMLQHLQRLQGENGFAASRDVLQVKHGLASALTDIQRLSNLHETDTSSSRDIRKSMIELSEKIDSLREYQNRLVAQKSQQLRERIEHLQSESDELKSKVSNTAQPAAPDDSYQALSDKVTMLESEVEQLQDKVESHGANFVMKIGSLRSKVDSCLTQGDLRSLKENMSSQATKLDECSKTVAALMTSRDAFGKIPSEHEAGRTHEDLVNLIRELRSHLDALKAGKVRSPEQQSNNVPPNAGNIPQSAESSPPLGPASEEHAIRSVSRSLSTDFSVNQNDHAGQPSRPASQSSGGRGDESGAMGEQWQFFKSTTSPAAETTTSFDERVQPHGTPRSSRKRRRSPTPDTTAPSTTNSTATPRSKRTMLRKGRKKAGQDFDR